MKVLIDGDSLVYTVGFASQKNVWQARDGEGTVYCENEAKQTVLGFVEDQAGELGELEITRRIEVSPPEHAFHTIKVMVQKIATRAKANNYKIYLTGDGNFREGVATIMGYKHNRLDAEKPQLYQQIRDYMVQHHKATIVTGMEADDALSIVHRRSVTGDPINVSADPSHEVLRHPDECIIAAIDKDLRNIPGKHINFDKRVAENNEYKFIVVTEEEGRRTFWKQVLTGDSSDNILGIPGMGPKKADAILDDVAGATEGTEEDYFWAVYGEYKRKFGIEPFNYRRYDAFEDTTATFRKRVAKPDDQLLPEQKLVGSALIFLVENARLLWMLREAPNAEGTHWWHPPVSYEDIVLLDDNEKWLAKDAEAEKYKAPEGTEIFSTWSEGRGKWFWCDEDGHKHGKFGTQKKAKDDMKEYQNRGPNTEHGSEAEGFIAPSEQDTQSGNEDTQSGEPMTAENQIPVSAEEAAAIDASVAEGIAPVDPVHAEWFFWDETWANRYGPFETAEIARIKLSEYAASLQPPEGGLEEVLEAAIEPTQDVGDVTQKAGDEPPADIATYEGDSMEEFPTPEVVGTDESVTEPEDKSSEETGIWDKEF